MMMTLAEAEIGRDVFIMAFGGMGFVLILLTGIFWYAWHDDQRKRQFRLQKEREQTHREIAAYVAEGSISPPDAERMLKAMGPVGSAEVAERAKFELNQHRAAAPAHQT